LRCIPRRCGVRKKVRLTPWDLRALPAAFLQGRMKNESFYNFFFGDKNFSKGK
jgi:hypothetical protein